MTFNIAYVSQCIFDISILLTSYCVYGVGYNVLWLWYAYLKLTSHYMQTLSLNLWRVRMFWTVGEML